MSSYHINDLDHYPRTYSFLPNTEKDENGENLMTQSLVIQAPYRRIRHPELTPVIINRDSFLSRDERNNDIMSQSLIVPPYRRVRHTELTPVQTGYAAAYKSNTDGKAKQFYPQYQQSYSVPKAPKRAFSMTRLDQLAKPRQRYLEESLKLRASKTKENLCSAASVRPTSTVCLASKQQSSNTSNQNNSSVQSTNSGTLLLRQRTSARKQRPVSYAGYSLGLGSTNQAANNSILDSSVQQPYNSNKNVSAKNKSPFSNVINRSSGTNNNSGSLSRHSLMISSIDGSMINSLHNTKPTPPRKPSHIKAAAAARKLAKQEIYAESDQMKKSDSSSRINQQQENSRMKKSVTNPERISELLNEKLNESQDKKVIKSQKSNILNKSNDKLDLNDKNLKRDNLFVENDKSSNQMCQLIDLNNGDMMSNKLSNELSDELLMPKNEVDEIECKRRLEEEEQKRREEEDQRRKEEEEKRKKEEEEEQRKKEEEERKKRLEEEEQKRLENEEMKRRALEEEKKRLAREEKERELERRVKEKAEKARLEMEERLRKDEQERIERKKRLDAIMSRTRKNPSSANSKQTSPITENASGQQIKLDQNKIVTEQNELNKSNELNNELMTQNPDVVEDAIKSNLIKLTNNDNLNNRINNGKSELHNFIESETIIQENKNISLINGFKEMKMSTNSTFVFSQTSTDNLKQTFTPGAN